MTRRYLLPLLALLSSAPAANGAPEPPRQEDRTPAGAAQPTDGASNPSPPYDLRSIARREAEREEAMLTARVRALIQELRTTGDPNVALIQQRLGELSQIGKPALPQLLEAMNHEEEASPVVNAGQNAARATARLAGRDVFEALAHLAREGTRFGRRNAARALGWRDDSQALPLLVTLLEDADEEVRRDAIRALGDLGRPEGAPSLLPFVASPDEVTASIALQSLAAIEGSGADEAVLTRLRAAEAAASWMVVAAALHYVRNHPSMDGLDAAKGVLANDAAPGTVREAAIEALSAIALANPSTQKVVLQALSAATRTGLRPLTRAAALAMLALGDDSGVDAVTADFDFEIQRNPRNFNSRYKRADVYLEFRRWKDAYQDIQYGLKVEKEPRDPERVYFALARAAAGLKRFGDAAKYLRRLTARDFSNLPQQFPEFVEMAEDTRYGSIFEPES